MILGGAYSEPRAELFDPSTHTTSLTGRCFQERLWVGASMTLMPSGEVLIVGGSLYSYSALREAEWFAPLTGTFRLNGQ